MSPEITITPARRWSRRTLPLAVVPVLALAGLLGHQQLVEHDCPGQFGPGLLGVRLRLRLRLGLFLVAGVDPHHRGDRAQAARSVGLRGERQGGPGGRPQPQRVDRLHRLGRRQGPDQAAVIMGLVHSNHPPQVIAYSANDPTSEVPALEAAAKAGIKVIGFDSDVTASARLYFIQDTAYPAMAQSLINARRAASSAPRARSASSPPPRRHHPERLGSAPCVCTSCRSTRTSKIGPIGYGQSNESISQTQATNLINSNPDLLALIPYLRRRRAGSAGGGAGAGQGREDRRVRHRRPQPEPEVLRQRLADRPVPLERGGRGSS